MSRCFILSNICIDLNGIVSFQSLFWLTDLRALGAQKAVNRGSKKRLFHLLFSFLFSPFPPLHFLVFFWFVDYFWLGTRFPPTHTISDRGSHLLFSYQNTQNFSPVGSVFQKCLFVSQSVSQSVTREPIELSGDS